MYSCALEGEGGRGTKSNPATFSEGIQAGKDSRQHFVSHNNVSVLSPQKDTNVYPCLFSGVVFLYTGTVVNPTALLSDSIRPQVDAIH